MSLTPSSSSPLFLCVCVCLRVFWFWCWFFPQAKVSYWNQVWKCFMLIHFLALIRYFDTHTMSHLLLSNDWQVCLWALECPNKSTLNFLSSWMMMMLSYLSIVFISVSMVYCRRKINWRRLRSQQKSGRKRKLTNRLQTNRLNMKMVWRRKARRTRCPRSSSSDTGWWTAVVGNRGRWEGQSEFLFPVQWMMSIFANNCTEQTFFKVFIPSISIHIHASTINVFIYAWVWMVQVEKGGQHFPIAN